MLNIFSVIVLAVVEGLTEYLPISSTGHLILFGSAIDVTGEKADTFKIFIQGGAILAAAVIYFRRFRDLFRSPSDPSVADPGFTGLQGLLKIGAACLPAFIAGALLHDLIKRELFAPMPVAAATFVGALLILVVESGRLPTRVSSLGELSIAQCIAIGAFQCLALWPGMSRSGSTIIGGMTVGLDRKAAAEFSFIVAVPTLLAAVVYDMWKSYQLFALEDVPALLLGSVVSFLTAAFAIRTFIAFLGRYTLRPFAYYRIALAMVVVAVVV